MYTSPRQMLAIFSRVSFYRFESTNPVLSITFNTELPHRRPRSPRPRLAVSYFSRPLLLSSSSSSLASALLPICISSYRHTSIPSLSRTSLILSAIETTLESRLTRPRPYLLRRLLVCRTTSIFSPSASHSLRSS